ncbi:MAG: extracellular solute-binding protein, partial [Acutalibacter sp.]|nr:extracellular solute-binding protein [Acutalibacter sp.]
MKAMNIKKILAVLLAAAMLLSLAACGGGNSSSGNNTPNSTPTNNGGNEPTGEEIVVTIPTYYVGENVGAVYFEPAVARFNEKYAGQYRIELEEVIEQSYTDIISQQVQAGKAPLLLATPNSDWVKTAVIPSNLYQPMNEFLDAHPEVKELCLDTSIEYCTQDNGDIVSVPIVTVSNVGLFYNSALYTPTADSISAMSVDEFVNSLGDNKLAFQTVDNAWTSVLFLTSLIANEEGGTELLQQYDGEKLYDFNQPCILNAVTKLQDIWSKYAASNSVGAAYPDAANGFMSNQAAVIF